MAPESIKYYVYPLHESNSATANAIDNCGWLWTPPPLPLVQLAMRKFTRVSKDGFAMHAA